MRARTWTLFAATVSLGLIPALPAAQAGDQVLCRYTYYGTVYSWCTAPPIDKAKLQCEKSAQETHKEKLSCWCTDDPNFIRDYCDQQEGGKK